MILEKNITYRSYLEREFQMRVSRNPQYSLRAFARDLALPASNLSQIFKGTCGLSRLAAQRIAKRLQLSAKETEYFVTLIDAEHNRSSAGKAQAQKKLEALREQHYDEIDLEGFKLISDWYHFAILELTELEDFQSDSKWIARKLNISLKEVEAAIERLLTYGLLIEDQQRGFRQTQNFLATPSGIPSREIKNHHAQILQKALVALESEDLKKRDFSTITFSMDSSQIDEAREVLLDFRRKFNKRFQIKSPKDRVYCMSIQLFPIDQPLKK